MTGDVATLDDAAEEFGTARRRLFGIAYRMLGSAAEAEDVVQETWVRWQTTDRTVVRNPQAFLTTTATRLAINVLQSARSRREAYVGPWLPEPVDTSADPTLGAERAEALDVAVLVLLERLTPTERAAYVLREAFDYGYAEIARIVGTTPAAARQLVSRARKDLASGRRNTVRTADRRALLEAFLAAARAGDVAALERLFADDVVSRSDSDGRAKHVARVAVRGRTKVARLLSAFADEFWAGVTTRPVVANGTEAVGMVRDGELVGVLSVTASDDGVHELAWQLNPEKLAGYRQALQDPPA
ncbi:RNA polymerase sigma-70 factor [Promicromonospora citrea]|uniref:RNA polymerase sigma24 factor n=1 Tax=Promicromonospora citrea TaxID=43677 RepID=A0A8H9GEC2_9MICO|nr:RNA polymerase sigma-70 factor [Promicromonospora citrea]NNH50930.1 RNA polymerase sigma-70 factor [Promicromonospora citrea]GGM15410.1 RNA polymerase sigma24 factor [Promicromonospora citrea]